MGDEILSQSAIDALLALLAAADEPADTPVNPASAAPTPPWRQADGPAVTGNDHHAEDAA